MLGDLMSIRGWELPKGMAPEAEGVAASSTVVSHVIRWLQRDSMMLKRHPKAVLQLATDTPVNRCASLPVTSCISLLHPGCKGQGPMGTQSLVAAMPRSVTHPEAPQLMQPRVQGSPQLPAPARGQAGEQGCRLAIQPHDALGQHGADQRPGER